MAGKTFYGENGDIERICYREGCYWKMDGKCGDNGEIRRYGKMCIKELGKKCEKWREDDKWSDKTQY